MGHGGPLAKGSCVENKEVKYSLAGHICPVWGFRVVLSGKDYVQFSTVSRAVAHQTQGAHVGQVALAAAGSDGEDVVGVPEVAAESPILFELLARLVVELALIFAQLLGIHAAERADSAVAGKDLLAQVAGIGA